MKRNRRRWLFIIVGIVLIILVLFGMLEVIPKINNSPTNVYMFTDIRSFLKLDPYAISDARDAKIGGLQYSDSYCKEVSFDGEQFNVYAYVFENVTDAQAYFAKQTGKDTDRLWSFTTSSNYFFHTDYISYCQNYLYRVEGGSYLSTTAFINWLNADFPIDLLEDNVSDNVE